MSNHYTVLPFFTSDTGEARVSSITCDEFGVPIAFLRNCGTWEGTARRVSTTGELMDEHLVRVEIAIAGTDYVQTNTVRIGTPREVVAKYFGNFQDGKLVFPLTDEVYTLGGEKASAFSGVAWSVTDEIIVYCGSRTVQGCKTHYHEIITLSDRDPQRNNASTHRVRTTQLFEDGIYKLVTMIDEVRVAGS
ncbi:hypothetical protein H6G89_28310 [Oscillatoria sp. FACHB-1407]|uniref:hypothetical protein n=1 Tax=Oscillatoria sp. FACHB-1407 TaxID=2692847 RepID=UPI0016888C2F|nr:hypothetical protein [Oscillatoria sp. FACHB-1407]MBD2464911.1 hypothetical protein [Oscillatoria sp. FACHB-1407]